jgi:4-amino-4-deoxy-L-arabinose transferase-like glycosyltransferase
LSSSSSASTGRSTFVAALLVVLCAGLALRTLWVTADPPTHATVGIVWHDEGPWVHNARNMALWGTWRTDAWNPMFVAPVFTGLEYASFAAFGVGTWQARLVPILSGLFAVLCLTAGLRAVAGPRAALIGALFLSTNYVFVMWNRAALMESTMTAFITAGWAAYTVAQQRPRAGLLAGVAVVLAWFTKASAAFFVGAILLDACLTIGLRWFERRRGTPVIQTPPAQVRAAWWTLAGLTGAALVCLALFVLPNWTEYRFYNWQMSVTRKPEFTVKAFADRASWIPIVHDFFTRMWLLLVLSIASVFAVASRWRQANPSERLLAWWLVLGIAELIVHDSGNERRFVMFIPALAGLAALLFGRAHPFTAAAAAPRGLRWAAAVPLLAAAYLLTGSIIRLAFLYLPNPSGGYLEVSPSVRWSAVAAALLTGAALVWWRQVCSWLAAQRLDGRGALLLIALAVAGDLAQYGQWAAHRTYENYEASKMLAGVLPPGTLVHGKLANGLALENRIRPIFVGRGFGNYEDRTRRDDVRYILTYTAPSLGYESQRNNPVIKDVLDAYPQHTIIMTFDVAETATGNDRAALIDKFGGRPAGDGRTSGRAHD